MCDLEIIKASKEISVVDKEDTISIRSRRIDAIRNLSFECWSPLAVIMRPVTTIGSWTPWIPDHIQLVQDSNSICIIEIKSSNYRICVCSSYTTTIQVLVVFSICSWTHDVVEVVRTFHQSEDGVGNLAGCIITENWATNNRFNTILNQSTISMLIGSFELGKGLLQ